MDLENGNGNANANAEGFSSANAANMTTKGKPESLSFANAATMTTKGKSKSFASANAATMSMKGSSNKPPRPPKAARQASWERYMKRFEGTPWESRAKLEILRSQRVRQKIRPHNSSASSSKANVWSLLLTLSLCCIFFLEGLSPKKTTEGQNLKIPVVFERISSKINCFISDAASHEKMQVERLKAMGSRIIGRPKKRRIRRLFLGVRIPDEKDVTFN